MLNLFKSGTTVSNGTIRKNNFIIGVNDTIGYGPTSSTGFWAGITPPSGGYTIYTNKSTFGPSIFTSTDDNGVIITAQKLGGTNINTIYDALTWFDTQSDRLITNIDYPSIVTSGMVLCLDAGYIPSYPRTGTTWDDLSGNNLNGTATGTFPTFNSSNEGNLVFNSTPISVGNSSIFNLTNLTLSVWFKTTATRNQILIGKSYLTSYYLNVAPNATPSASTFSFWTNNSELVTSGKTTLGDGNWHNITATMSGTAKTTYYDGLQATTGTGTVPATDIRNLIIGNSEVLNNSFSGSMANVLVYNRALSSSEVISNYNAYKSRFGL